MSEVNTSRHFTHSILKNLQQYDVPGDGTCLIHSFLFLTDAKYRALETAEERERVGVEYRKNLAHTLLDILSAPKKNQYQKDITSYLNTDIAPTLTKESFPENLPVDVEYTIENYITHVIADPVVYLGDVEINLLERVKPVLFVILQNTSDKPPFFIRQQIKHAAKQKDIILVNYIDGIHYEPVAVKTDTEPIFQINSNTHPKLHKATMKQYNDFVAGKVHTLSRSPPVRERSVSSRLIQSVQSIPPSNQDVPVQEIDNVDGGVTVIPSQDVLIEDIEDLNELMVTHYTENVTIHDQDAALNDLHELFSTFSRGMTSSQLQNYKEMLFSDDASSHSPTFKRLVPVVCAARTFYIDKQEKQYTETVDVTTANYEMDWFLRFEPQTFFKRVDKINTEYFYKPVYHQKYQTEFDIIRPTKGRQTEIRGPIVRLCPSLYDEMMTGNVVGPTMDTQCERFVFYNFDKNGNVSGVSRKKEELNTETIVKNKFLESHMTPNRTYRICGYFLPNKSNAMPQVGLQNSYEVINISAYYNDFLMTIRKGDALVLSLLNGTKVDCVVTSIEAQSILHLSLQTAIVYNGKTTTNMYFDRKHLSHNDFNLNRASASKARSKRTPYFEKRLMFENQDVLFLFEEQDYEIFQVLCFPTIHEYAQMKMHSPWFNHQDCIRDLRKYFDVSLESVPNTFITTDRDAYPIAPDAMQPMPTNISLSSPDETTAQWLYGKTFPLSKSVAIRKNNSHLHRVTALQRMYDSGLTHVIRSAKDDLNAEQHVASNTSLYTKEMSKLQPMLAQVEDKRFYESVDELMQVKDVLRANARYQYMDNMVEYMKLYNAFVDKKGRHLKRMDRFFKKTQSFFTMSHKPQDIKNESFIPIFLNHNTPHDTSYQGSLLHLMQNDQVFVAEDDSQALDLSGIPTNDDLGATLDTEPLDQDEYKIESQKSIVTILSEIAKAAGVTNLFGKVEIQRTMDTLDALHDVKVTLLKQRIQQLMNEYIKNEIRKFETANASTQKKQKEIITNKAKQYSKLHFKQTKSELDILILTACVVLFTETKRFKVRITNLNKSHSRVFAFNSFNEVTTQGAIHTLKRNTNQSVLDYMTSILQMMFIERNNTSMLHDKKQIKSYLIDIIETVLKTNHEFNDELHVIQRRVKQQYSEIKPVIRPVKFKPTFVEKNSASTCDDVKITLDAAFVKPHVPKKRDIFEITKSMMLLQLRKTNVRPMDTPDFEQKPLNFSKTTTPTLLLDQPINDVTYGADKKRIKELSKEVNDYWVDTLGDTYNLKVVVDDLTIQDLFVDRIDTLTTSVLKKYNMALDHFIHTKMLVPWVRIVQGFSPEEHLNYLKKYVQVDFFKDKSDTQKTFFEKMVDKRVNGDPLKSKYKQLAEDFHEDIIMKMKNVTVMENTHTTTIVDYKYNTLVCFKKILEFCKHLVEIGESANQKVNTMMKSIVQITLDGLSHELQKIHRNDTNHVTAFAQLREEFKQNKLAQKQNMTNGMRNSVLLLEKNGIFMENEQSTSNTTSLFDSVYAYEEESATTKSEGNYFNMSEDAFDA